MKPNRSGWGALGQAAVVALVAVATSCHKSEASEPQGPQPPPGQVWLTTQQVRDAKIETQTVAEQDVDDTIFTSGRVSLEDLKSAHVFTPVTGRVVRIAAQLGQRVKKGDPLAVIESPDIGNAVSDVHKAQADVIAAEHDFKRKKELFEEKAGSAADQEAADQDEQHPRLDAGSETGDDEDGGEGQRQLGQDCAARPHQQLVGEDRVDQLGVDLGARHGDAQRRRQRVRQPRRCRGDQHWPAA